MSNNNKDSELSDDYMKKQYQMIKELYEGEKILNNILDNKTRKNDNFTIFDKGWLDKWKIIVGYQQFKEKCIKCKTEEDIKEYINDIREFYKKENVKQKLNELGKMKTDNLINISKKSKNIKFLNEKSNFIPILSHQSTYFNHLIDKVFSLNSEIENGIIFFYNTILEKDKEQKIILLFKGEGENTNYIRPVITLKPKEDIKKVLKDLKKKTISEILNLKEYKFEIIKPEETIGSKEEITLNQNKFEKKKDFRAVTSAKAILSDLQKNNCCLIPNFTFDTVKSENIVNFYNVMRIRGELPFMERDNTTVSVDITSDLNFDTN